MNGILRILFLSCLLWSGCAWSGDGEEYFTLYLVRHAESAVDDSADPDLAPEGVIRAERLSEWLADKNIRAVWSSDFRRTRYTVLPLAEALGLGVQLYDPRGQEVIASALLAGRRNALVSGHSNTIPALASRLCGCEVEPMNESEYDRLLLIHLSRAGPALTTLDQREVLVRSED